MSGGSYDYAYSKIEQLAEDLRIKDDPRRLALQRLLLKVSVAIHDVEWVDSSDYGEGDDHAAIDACFFGDSWKIAAYDALMNELNRVVKNGRVTPAPQDISKEEDSTAMQHFTLTTPVFTNGKFGWRCACGAESKKSYSTMTLATSLWRVHAYSKSRLKKIAQLVRES